MVRNYQKHKEKKKAARDKAAAAHSQSITTLFHRRAADATAHPPTPDDADTTADADGNGEGGDPSRQRGIDPPGICQDEEINHSDTSESHGSLSDASSAGDEGDHQDKDQDQDKGRDREYWPPHALAWFEEVKKENDSKVGYKKGADASKASFRGRFPDKYRNIAKPSEDPLGFFPVTRKITVT